MPKTCKLCLKEKSLIKKSHILPDFLYTPLFDEKHRLRSLDMTQLKNDDLKVSKPPTGEYEGGILCSDCDNRIIGQHETYISNLIKNLLPERQKVIFKELDSLGVKSTLISNLDYRKSKLFLSSLIWRSSITKRPHYKKINLGPYEEKIRIELFTSTISNSSLFQINIIEFERVDDFTNFIGIPVKHKAENTTFYSMIITGFLIIYFLKESQLSRTWQAYRLKESGEIMIPKMSHQEAKKFIFGYAGLT